MKTLFLIISLFLSFSSWAQTTCDGVIPSGMVQAFARATCPIGWIKADGSAVSRTTKECLFLAIGTSHGRGDNSTTFNVPDYRGRFLRGVSEGSGLDPDANSRTAMATGGNTGNAVGSVQGDVFGSHSHSYTNYPSYNLGSIGADANNPSRGNFGGGANGTTSGASGGNETRPKNANVVFCVKE